jgi:hypothetical protein
MPYRSLVDSHAAELQVAGERAAAAAAAAALRRGGGARGA